MIALSIQLIMAEKKSIAAASVASNAAAATKSSSTTATADAGTDRYQKMEKLGQLQSLVLAET